jgi:hypothetical protein
LSRRQGRCRQQQTNRHGSSHSRPTRQRRHHGLSSAVVTPSGPAVTVDNPPFAPRKQQWHALDLEPYQQRKVKIAAVLVEPQAGPPPLRRQQDMSAWYVDPPALQSREKIAALIPPPAAPSEPPRIKRPVQDWSAWAFEAPLPQQKLRRVSWLYPEPPPPAPPGEPPRIRRAIQDWTAWQPPQPNPQQRLRRVSWLYPEPPPPPPVVDGDLHYWWGHGRPFWDDPFTKPDDLSRSDNSWSKRTQ